MWLWDYYEVLFAATLRYRYERRSSAITPTLSISGNRGLVCSGISSQKAKSFLFSIYHYSICLLVCLFTLVANGWQYNQWRNAGDIPVNRNKTLSGVDAFQLPLRPPLVILLSGWAFLRSNNVLLTLLLNNNNLMLTKMTFARQPHLLLRNLFQGP